MKVVDMSRIKPDIAMPFKKGNNDGAVAVIAVRPESNKVSFESLILRGIASYAELVYMANLSGTVVNNANIIESQYKVQNYFAQQGKSEVIKYPELVALFEDKFKVKASDAKIIGAFEAVTTYKDELHKTDTELFHTIVQKDDLLEAFGHTIKKIGDFYVVNYDMPAVFSKHNKETDIFVIAIKLNDSSVPFSDLSRGIYEEFEKDSSISIIDSESRTKMEWFNQVRRTYHISNSHIKAMFDMTDYILGYDGVSIGFSDTPLGEKLLQRQRVTEDNLKQLKENPIVKLMDCGEEKLVNIIEYARDTDKHMSLQECCELVEAVVF